MVEGRQKAQHRQRLGGVTQSGMDGPGGGAIKARLVPTSAMVGHPGDFSSGHVINLHF